MRPEPYDETVNSVNQVPSTLGWIVFAVLITLLVVYVFREGQK